MNFRINFIQTFISSLLFDKKREAVVFVRQPLYITNSFILI